MSAVKTDPSEGVNRTCLKMVLLPLPAVPSKIRLIVLKCGRIESETEKKTLLFVLLTSTKQIDTILSWEICQI